MSRAKFALTPLKFIYVFFGKFGRKCKSLQCVCLSACMCTSWEFFFFFYHQYGSVGCLVLCVFVGLHWVQCRRVAQTPQCWGRDRSVPVSHPTPVPVPLCLPSAPYEGPWAISSHCPFASQSLWPDCHHQHGEVCWGCGCGGKALALVSNAVRSR